MAIRFATAGDYLENTAYGSPANATTTVVCWAYLAATTVNGGQIMRFYTAGGTTITSPATATDGVTQRLSSPGNSFNSTYTYKIGQWSKVAYVTAGASGTLYGADAESSAVTVATGTLTAGTPTRYSVGGRGSSDSTSGWNGRIAGLKIYDRILTADEIRLEWTQILPVSYAALYAAYPLDNGTADGRADYSGNGRLLIAGSTLVEDGPPVPRERLIIRPYLFGTLTTATAGNASGTGTGNAAGPSVTVAAGNAAGTGSANAAAPTLATSSVGNAAGTGSGNAAVTALAPVAALAGATGVANPASPGLVLAAEVAEGARTAIDVEPLLGAGAEHADGAGTANDAAVSVSGGAVTAVAALAEASGAALDATVGGVDAPVVSSGGWRSLLWVAQYGRAVARYGRGGRVGSVCPNDGERYRVGPRGELFCPFDGHRPR